MTRAQKIYLISFTLALAAMPALAIVVPRVLAYIPAVAGLLGYASYAFVFKERAVRYVPGFVIVSVVMAMMFVSTLWAIDPAVSLERAQKTSLLLICGAFLISTVMTVRISALMPYLKWFPYILFGAAAYACFEIGLNYPLYRLVRGEDFDAGVGLAVFNRATVTMALLLIPSLVMLRHFHSAQICLLAVLATIIPLLMMGESQSALLGLAVAGLTYVAFPYKWKYSYALLAGAIGALMLAMPFIATWAFRNYAADMNIMPLLGHGGAYAGARLEIWDYVSRYALQNPLYGFGVEAARQVESFGSAEIYQEGQTILHPHNFALQLWIEFGLAGVVAGIALVGYLVMKIGRLPPRQARIMLPVLLATLAVASVSYGIWQGWWVGLLFAVTAAALLALRLARQDSGYMS